MHQKKTLQKLPPVQEHILSNLKTFKEKEEEQTLHHAKL